MKHLSTIHKPNEVSLGLRSAGGTFQCDCLSQMMPGPPPRIMGPSVGKDKIVKENYNRFT